MATFVLVHGAYHGGWCWKKVTPLLRSVDHAVVTPTLTGLGERAHLLTPAVTLSTHIQDIVSVLVAEDLTDVILVGHSYAGMVITGVAEAAPERLGRIVYLDAVVPDHGETGFDMYPLLRDEAVTNAIEINGAKAHLPAFREWLIAEDVTDPDDLAWMEPRLTPHPLATLQEPIQLSSNRALQIPSSFVRCLGNPSQSVAKGVEKAMACGWEYHAVESGHEAMITAPRALARLLSEFAAQSGRPV